MNAFYIQYLFSQERAADLRREATLFQMQIAVHVGITCDACNTSPIRGLRYKCTECYDFDLCAACCIQGQHSHHSMEEIEKPKSKAVSCTVYFKKLGFDMFQFWQNLMKLGDS